jgi:hypothetical protein
LLLTNEWFKVRTLPFVFVLVFDNFIAVVCVVVGSTFVVDVAALLCGCVVGCALLVELDELLPVFCGCVVGCALAVLAEFESG